MAKSFAENIQTALTNPNVRKFLDMLGKAEGADYNTTFGGGRVESLAKHPNLRAEFTQTDGKKNTSTAAGRYQFMPDTWNRLQKQYPEQMPDFSPQSQDFAVAVLLSQRKALQDVVNGRFGTAVKKVGAEWASLPTSPYKQPKKSWDDINRYLDLPVGGGSGGGGGAGQNGISEKQRKQLYTAYRTGAMTDQQKAEYERDFEAVKPAGAKLQPVKASPPAAPYELPIDVLMAYKNGSMTPQQAADFERDYRAGKISAPAHVNFSLSATETPIDQRDYTGSRLQEFSDRATQALGNTARGIMGDGVVDAATAVPRTIIGGVEALIQGAGGMVGASGAGLAGIGAGIGSLVQGKGIDESIAQAGRTIESTQAAIQPYLPQPFIAPNTAHSIGESLAIPMFATEGAGQANYDAYGNATSAALTQGLGDAAMAALGFRAVGKPVAPTARAMPTEYVDTQRFTQPTPMQALQDVGQARNPVAQASAASMGKQVRVPPVTPRTDETQPTPRPQPTPDTPAPTPTPTPTPRPDITPTSDRIILDAENPRTVIPAPDAQPAGRAEPTPAEVTTVGAEGLNVLHGSTRADLTADQVQVFNPTATQNRKGRKNGGFYTTPDAAVADKYANMPRRDGAPITPTVYDVQIKAGSRVLQKEGDITRLDEAYINEQRAAGVDVIAGKDPRGQVEYAVINPEAVGNLTPRAKVAAAADEGLPPDSLFQRNKPQATAIGDRLAEQVRASGRPADEAVQAGKLAESYYAATAKALGLTPDEVFAQVGLTAERADAGGANAALRLGEIKHSMVFGDTANPSSFIHEVGHHFLETHAKLADQSPKLQADVDVVLKWAGHDGRAWSDLTASQKREVHEKFAESFEQYLLTGKAPTAGLKKVFEDFKAWLTDVYTSMTEFAQTNPRASLSPEISGVMDRMLGGKAEKAANKERSKKRKSEPVEADLLDFKRSAPVAGGVSPDMHQHRYNVLRDIGLTDEQIRGGSVEGDLKRLEWDAELAKYDTEYGIKMKNQLELERQKLREYGDGVVESMGGTPKASPESRGAAIVKPLEAYKAWYKAKIKEFYNLADERAGMTGGIELSSINDMVKSDSNWAGVAERRTLRKGLRGYMREFDLIDKPVSAKQAEKMRQWLNQQWTPQTGDLIKKLNDAIDESVFSTLGQSVYGEARAVNTKYHRIFSDPKGIAKLLDVDGINRSISHEKVASNLSALAENDAAQFRHIMRQLEDMPTNELQNMADQAIGEIRSQIAEKITAYDSTKPDTVAAIGKALAPYRGEKLREIFGEKGAQKLETFVAAHGILRRVDAQPSGTSSMTRNVIMKLAEAGTAMVGGGAGLTAGGAYGAAAGTLIGQQIGARIKGSMVAAVDKKSYGKAMSPRQLETMRQTYAATGRRLAALPETEAAAAAARDAPDSTRARTLNARLERTKEWMQFYERLTDDQKAAIKKTGAAVWLSSVSGLGDNQATSNGDNQ